MSMTPIDIRIVTTKMLIPVKDVTHVPAQAQAHVEPTYYVVLRKSAQALEWHPPEVSHRERVMVPADLYDALQARFDLQGQALFQTSNTAEQLCLQRDQAWLREAELAKRVAALERQLFDRSRP